MVIIYIILGLIGFCIALFLLRFLALIFGPALLCGGVTWLIWDNFWTGCIIGGTITLIAIIRNPGKFFSEAFEEASTPTQSSSYSSSESSDEYITDKLGYQRKVRYRDSDSMYDDFGNHYRSDDGGSTWYQID